MIEKTVLDYLSGALGEPAYMKIPEDPPRRFLYLEKTGSGERDCIYTAKLAVQSYGGSTLEAAQLNDRVKEAMKGLTALDEVTRVKLNSDYKFPDTARKRERYQAVFDITHY